MSLFKQRENKTCSFVGWHPHGEGWYKVNTDGAMYKVSSNASIGEVIRDNHGTWIFGFFKYIGCCSTLNAELWKALEGLQFAWSLGFQRVALEMNSMTAIQLIQDESVELHHSTMLLAIKEMIQRPWRIKAGMIDILVIATFIISMSPSFCYARPPSSDFSLPAPVTVARNPSPPVDVAPAAGENISNGLDPELIQAFPTFYYSTVKEFRREKYGLECAICLGEFKDEDMLRLLTICCHVFHKECVDLWLESHKTCPVCRGELDVLSKKSPLLIRSNSMHEISTNAESSANQSPVEDSVCIDIKDDNDEKVDGEDKVQVTSSTKEQQSRKNERMENFSRSHSTGHSIGRAKEEDRYTLRLPEHIKIKIVRGHHAARSCTVFGEFRSPSNDRHRGSGEPSETRIGD
ncbi:hypothetical protein Gotri_008562 [Gossypium trilobum]|uniref:RING-type E3 ubiquitin transferase n=1 Tax=Gossypium trilobum TaxID=34281 RepID=A0A7J9EKH0_9ROSI|nr:hypothetical protein [Gossypium trilobum]